MRRYKQRIVDIYTIERAIPSSTPPGGFYILFVPYKSEAFCGSKRCLVRAEWRGDHMCCRTIYLCGDCMRCFVRCVPKQGKGYIVDWHRIGLDWAICHLKITPFTGANEVFVCVACSKIHQDNTTNSLAPYLCAKCLHAARTTVEVTTATHCKIQQQKMVLCWSAGILTRDIWQHMYGVWLQDSDFHWESLSCK